MMAIKWVRAACLGLLCGLVVGCGGGGGGGGSPQPPTQPQTIAFNSTGPIAGGAGTTVTNVASGGAGTGAITYSSNNTAVASVDASTGVASLLTIGSATITATKAASSGFASATATYMLNVSQGSQTLTFVSSGPINALIDTVAGNTASGGAGTGAITYSSSDTKVVVVNATSGATTAVGVGSATVTATKAADANFFAAQASYTINVQTLGKISAWIGSDDTTVSPPQSANGKMLGSARIAECQVGVTAAECSSANLTAVTGAAVLDTKATLANQAYYAIVDGNTIGAPIVVSSERFSERILHGTAFFNGKYWVIGGGVPQIPRVGPTLQWTVQSDVWSSVDGKSWKLELANAPFGRRWVHHTFVFANKLWIVGGLGAGATGVAWNSVDGVNWQQASTVGVPQDPTYANLASTVFNGAMWIVHNGDAYSSSSDGLIWTKRSTNPIGVAAQGRGYATLTVYNNQMWYLGGAANYRAPELMGGPTGNATNDVWRSSDGITWTQVTPTTPFPARYRHVSFVIGGQLWVLGGRGFVNGVDAPLTDDSYSTTDGVTWTKRNSSEIERGVLMSVVQESNRVTLIGGVHRSFMNRVFQSTNGESWSEQLPLSFSPQLLGSAVSFNGYLWLIGGGRIETNDTNEVWRSADGINWSQVTTSGSIFSPRSGHRVLAFNNRLWLIGGYDYFATEGGTPNYFNDVWSSADGVTWTQHPTPLIPARAGHEVVAFNGRMWVIGGSGVATSFNDVWSSADGQQWRQETAAAQFLPRVGHRVLAFNNQLYLLGGTSGAGNPIGTNEVWRSSDGIAWSQLNGTHFSPRLEHSAVVFGNRMYVVGGTPHADLFAAAMYNDVWSSSDGITWQNDLISAPFGARRLAWLTTHGNELFLIGGYGVGRRNDVWKSANGTQWRAAFSHDIVAP